MTHDEEENAVRQLGALIGYQRLIQHASRLRDREVNLSPNEGRSMQGIICEQGPTDTGSVTC